MTTTARRLRELIDRSQPLVAPGAYDALSARLVELAGFDAVYMTGFGAAASLLGKPDIGLLTATEMADQARRIASAVDVPVIADADTGYGNALNVERTVDLYERAGVAGIQLEDQVSPKRCGHMSGKDVVTAEEMAGKLRAAVAARRDPDVLLIARTDAIAWTASRRRSVARGCIARRARTRCSSRLRPRSETSSTSRPSWPARCRSSSTGPRAGGRRR
jgi:2-methylisocitrate lyase-like PEP mutase family enzyme